MIDWQSNENTLLLNPRMPESDRVTYERAWREICAEMNVQGQIGIATSGSSGSSHGKLVLLSRDAILANAKSVNERLNSTSEDIWMKTLPSFHVGGLGIYARSFLSGASVVESTISKWNPREFARELENSKATLLSLVPTQIYDLEQEGLRAPKSLRAVIVGGGRLHRDLQFRALELGWPVLPSYGLTECGSQVATASTPEDPRLIPLGHAKVRTSESTGRIEIMSDALLTGWIEFDSGRRARFHDPKRDGWFVTEDHGHLEEDGSLTVLGRSIDFIKIGGEGVSLARLEEKLAALKEDLKWRGEAAVLAAHDDRLGAKIVLLVNASEDPKALIERFNHEVLPFERIRSVHVLPELPKSPLGKLLRGEALAMAGLKSAH